MNPVRDLSCMKNILIVADVYPPEISSAANLMAELAEGLKKRGHKVTVLTAYPRHYLTEESRGKSFEIFSEENGVRVIRVKILPHHKVNFIIRGVSQITMPYIFFRQLKKYAKENFDAAIIYSPPLPLALIGGMIKRCYGAKFILNMQDIFPQNAIDLGVLNRNNWKHRMAIWLFERIEKRVYKEADKITFHSEGGMRFLIEKKGVLPEKIATVYNWVDLAPYKDLTKDISFRKQWNLENKFIFLFAGIMGPAQELDFLIEAAKRVSDIKNAVFLLVGDGMEKEKIEKTIKDYSLENVITKPFISKEEYPYLVKDSDVGIVCLSSKNKTPFTPGKFLGYMAAAKPIIAFLNKESDAFGLVEKSTCGYASVSGNLGKAEEIIRKIYKEKNSLEKMGENGFKYVSENMASDVCLEKLEKLF